MGHPTVTIAAMHTHFVTVDEVVVWGLQPILREHVWHIVVTPSTRLAIASAGIIKQRRMDNVYVITVPPTPVARHATYAGVGRLGGAIDGQPNKLALLGTGADQGFLVEVARLTAL